MKQLFNKLIENIEWVITSIFLLTLPVVYLKTTTLDPVLYPRYLALSIWVFVITLVILVKVYFKKYEFQFSNLEKLFFGAISLYILVNVISAFGSINLAEAIYKTFKEFTLMLSLFYFYQMLKNNEKGRDIAVKSAITMAAIFLAIGYYQLADSDFSKFKAASSSYGYYFRQAIGHVLSTLANINPFASYLFLSLGFSTYGIIGYKKTWRVISLLVWLSSLFFILILASKGVWGALGLAAFTGVVLGYIFLFQILPKQRNKELPIFLKVAALLLPFIVFFSTLYLVEKTELKVVQVVVEKAGQIFNPEKYISAMYDADNPTSVQTRTLVWANTVELVKDNPILGVGPGQWRIMYAKYGLDSFESGLRNGTKHFQRTHNDFLWILGETGIIGLFLYVFIFISILVIAFRNFKSNSSLKIQLFNGIAFSILVGYLVILFVDFSRERISHNVMYLLLFALILSFAPISNKNSFKLSRTLSLFLVALFLGLAAFNIRLAIDMVKGDKAARNIQIALRQNNQILLARAIRTIEGSYYTLDPFSTPIPYYKASIYHRQGKIEEAKQEFIKAYELHPYHIQVLSNLGTSYDLTNDKESAIKYYQKALDISPRFKEALVNMAIVHYNLNKLDEALDYIAQVKSGGDNPPKYEQTYLTICRKKAAGLVTQLDNEKLKIWYTDENKIKATFVRFQDEKIAFDKILLQELGK